MSERSPFAFAIASDTAGEIHVAIYTGAGVSVNVTFTDENALDLAERIRKVIAARPRAVSAADLGLEAA